MKKIILFISIITLLGCEKEDSTEPTVKMSLINITPETTDECLNGGFKIETGIDTDNNEVLDTNEVQTTNYICNGVNGNNSLLNITEEPNGDNCPNGGFIVETGIDVDNNNTLDVNEVQSTDYICNGKNSLLNIIIEPIGDNCASGGFKLETGVDTNNNEILDTNEIQSIDYICNQEDFIPINNLETKYNIEGVLTYGQSLAVAVGNGASDDRSDFKNTLSFIGGNSVINEIDLTSFVNVEDASNISYAPIMASTLAALSLIDSENRIDLEQLGYQYLALTGGVDGGAVIAMNKGTTAYQNVLNAVTSAKKLAKLEGKTFAWRVINWVQGEADRFDTKQAYYDKVEQLFNDFNTDIKAITGQTEDIIFIIHQTSPWLGRDLGGTESHPHINIQEAQLQLANDKENIYLDGGSYQFAYSDIFHPVDRAVIGLKQGVVLKRILNDNENWKTFKPVSHQVLSDENNYYTHLKFDVPVQPMRFDISGDTWHNPNGKQPNFGFEILNNGVEQQTAEPYITLGNTVVLTTETDPTGMTVRYAVNGHAGGGNLCDSQNIVIKNKDIDYVIDNFAVGFSEYIIN